MTSINPAANALLDAFNEAMGQDLAMNPAYERWLVEASNFGLSPEDFALAIRARIKFNASNACKKGVLLHYFVMGGDNIGVTISEAADAKAKLRVKAYAPKKAQALRDAGLPDEPPTPDAVKAGDMELIKALRRAAG